MPISHYMSWEGGVDLVAATASNLSMPNVIVHVARLVHTPAGPPSPAGMILFQPDPAKPPAVMGFIGADANVGAYFGPKIFAGTPFEKAPVLQASIEVRTSLPGSVSSRVVVAGFTFEVTLSNLGPLEVIQRPPAPMTPFTQQGLEAAARHATLRVNGQPINLLVPPIGISGGPAAVWSPAGVYAR